MPIETDFFILLSVALAIGLLIGAERGWQGREAEAGQRVAGLRTYGLIGLIGGTVGLLSQDGAPWLIGLVFIGLAISSATAYVMTTRAGHDFGITSETASLATYLLAALAGVGHIAPAAAAAIVMAMLLRFKEQLHGWLDRVRREELSAVLKLLLISVVLLPILPDEGYGPWQALNPHTIWLWVVLIAAISFFGYIAIRVVGPQKGIVFGGLAGGLASSTATTLAFSRISQQEGGMDSVLAAGILLASVSMIGRMIVVATLVNSALLPLLWLPALVMLIATLAPVYFLLRHQEPESHAEREASELRNPMELKSALFFGALLAVVLLLGRMLSEWAGNTGLWALAAASGVADVDAINISLSEMSREGIGLSVAVVGITIAAGVNSLVKAAMATGIGGRALGRLVIAPLAAAAVGGLAAALWQHF